MTKKLLITGGCSNTTQKYWAYTEKSIIVWPTIVAQDMDWDLLNLGIAGSSNDSIENSVYDAVLENQDRDIVVMMFWTEPCRGTWWDLDHYQLHGTRDRYTLWSGVEKKYPEMDHLEFCRRFEQLDNWSFLAWLKDRSYFPNNWAKEPFDQHLKYMYLIQDIMKRHLLSLAYNDDRMLEVDAQMVDFSLRSMVRLKGFLDSLKIPTVHKYSLSMTETMPWSYPHWKDDPLDIKEKAMMMRRKEGLQRHCSKHPRIKEMGMSRKDWQNGWCDFNKREQGYLLDCGHPNQKGQNLIADEFIECVNSLL